MMPIARFQLPDGRIARFEVPEGTTPEQAQSMMESHFAKPAKPNQPAIGLDPTADMTGLDKFRSGMGKAFVDVGRGAGQLFGMGDKADIDEARRLDAPLMDTGAGLAGNIAGNVAAYGSLAVVPGANTIAGGAALGALTGAAQPVGEGDSRLANAAIGGMAGVVVPTAIKAGKTIKAAVIDPFTDKGAQRIAGGLLNRTAGNSTAAAQRMASVKGATPGFNPTAAQSADDAGIAALERATRAANPGAFDDVERAQRQALADAVRGVAGDPVKREAAVAARESAVKPLYDATKKYAVQADDEINALLNRPSMQSAKEIAKKLAAERGAGLDEGINGQALHDIKMGLDDAIGNNATGMQGAQRNAALATKQDYLNWLESKIPEYGQARVTYADMSKPINQMDVGQAMTERLIPSLYRDMASPSQLNAQAFARALKDQGDDIARSATGMKGAKLESVMSPDQLKALRGVASDLQMSKSAELAGRGVGSDTVQKTAMSHIAAQAGIPNWMSNIARVPGGWAKRLGDAVYGSSDEKVKTLMAELLKNPQQAAQAMQAAGVSPSIMAQILKQGTQGLALSATPAMVNQ